MGLILTLLNITVAPEFKTTKQGLESQWQVNHLGHFLFTNLLLPALLKSSFGASVVNISSAGHRASGVHLDDVNFNVSQVGLIIKI
jgi:NAD(P)-dependent dehydrogenase (short-subunit alcohol dehydrogenase family)